MHSGNSDGQEKEFQFAVYRHLCWGKRVPFYIVSTWFRTLHTLLGKSDPVCGSVRSMMKSLCSRCYGHLCHSSLSAKSEVVAADMKVRSRGF